MIDTVDTLKAMARLAGNIDFKVVMEWLRQEEMTLLRKSCLPIDDMTIGREQGKALFINSFIKDVDNAEKSIENIAINQSKNKAAYV